MLEVIRVQGFQHPNGSLWNCRTLVAFLIESGRLFQTWSLFGLASEVRAWAENKISPLFCLFFFFLKLFLNFLGGDGKRWN